MLSYRTATVKLAMPSPQTVETTRESGRLMSGEGPKRMENRVKARVD